MFSYNITPIALVCIVGYFLYFYAGSGDTSDGLPGFTIKGITDLFKGNYFSLIFGMFWHCLKLKGPVAFDNSNFALPLAQRLLELGFETDEDNPVWEWKYGDLSKVYIKIFKKDQFKWQQRFSLKKDIDKIADALIENGFDPLLETKIITHGYIDDGIVFHNAFAQANQKTGWKFNIIGIDWHEMAQAPFYYSAAKNTKKVGELVGLELVSKVLIYELKQDPKLIHAIGHSLGAHVSGNIGKAVKESFVGKKIGRVTGLDPAEPYFYQVAHHKEEQLSKRIQPSDAEFVDIIHTNGNIDQKGSIKGALTEPDTYGLGFFEPLGHVDFYPNGGGPFQDGCKPPSQTEKNCNHQRAWQYYVESIEKGDVSFKSTACTDYGRFTQGNCTSNNQIPMGEALKKEMLKKDQRNEKEKLYFLKTLAKPDQPEPPFDFSL